MTDLKNTIRLEKCHFYLLGFVFLNFAIGQITGYSLNQNIIFILKVILYLTGLILFLMTIKPFKKKAIYYFFYTMPIVVIGLFILFQGIFLAMMSSVVLMPIIPKLTEYKTDKIKIYDRFQGFMAGCCSYEVVETKLYIFEKHLGYIKTEQTINGDKDEFKLENNMIVHKYQLYNDGEKNVRDTTEILHFE